MAQLPIPKVAQRASVAAFALLAAVAIGAAPIAEMSDSVADRAGVTSLQDVDHFSDSNDPDEDPAPLIQDPPEVQGPVNPGQKTLSPQHRRSRHRAPTST
jgi:hypothetical protein